MRALTGVMKYVGIVLLATVLIIAFAIGIMHFVPSVSIFGYCFRQEINANIKIYETADLGDLAQAESIAIEDGSLKVINMNIEAKNYHVRVMPHVANTVVITTSNNYIGLVKATEVTKENISNFNVPETPNYFEGVKIGQKKCVVNPYITNSFLKETQPEKGVFNLIVNEPSGLLSRNASNVITVYVPATCIVNLDITTKNGDIRLHNSTKEGSDELDKHLNVNRLDLETNKGNGEFKGLQTFDIQGKSQTDNLHLNELNIKTNGGSFDFTQFDEVVVNNSVKLESKKAKYAFNTLKSYYENDSTSDKIMLGEVSVSGTNVEFRANKVWAGADGFSYTSDTGVLKIDELYSGFIDEKTVSKKEEYKNSEGETAYREVKSGDAVVKETYISSASPYENTIFTESAVVELGTVIGKLGLENEMGQVKINHLCHQATIRTENSNISIETSGYLPDGRSNGTKLSAGVAREDLDKKNFTDTSSLILFTTYGDISVGEYYQDAVIYSKKGHITAYSKYNNDFKNDLKDVFFIEGEKSSVYWINPEQSTTTSVAGWYYDFETSEIDNPAGGGKTTIYSPVGEKVSDPLILAQMPVVSSGNKPENGEEHKYYSNTNRVGYAYYHEEAYYFKRTKQSDSSYLYEEKVTDSFVLAQLTANLPENDSKEGTSSYYFKNCDASTMRYYYSDISTKDGEVTITTDRNPVRVIASDKATINLIVKGVIDTHQPTDVKAWGVDGEENPVLVDTGVDYFAELNPFGDDAALYIAETKNGTVNATLPITSYLVQVNCKKIEGSIGATSEFGAYDKETKTRPEVQINANKTYQALIKITGKKAILSSDI